MIDNLKKWIDKANGAIPEDPMEALLILLTPVTPDLRAINEEIQKRIPALLKSASNSDPGVKELKKWKALFVYKSVIEDLDTSPYLVVLEKIDNQLSSEDVRRINTSEDNWNQAIQIASLYNAINPNTDFEKRGLRDHFPKQYDRGKSLKTLKNWGFAIQFTENDVIVENISKIENDIDNQVKELGGITLARYLFNKLDQPTFYSTEFDRFFITRSHNTYGIDQSPEVPVGYLLNLAVKHPAEKNITPEVEEKIQTLIQVSRIFINGVYDVQQYSMWSFIMASGSTIIESYRQMALWDTIFSITQMRPFTVLELIKVLFRAVPADELPKRIPFDLEHGFNVVDAVLQYCNPFRQPVRFEVSDISELIQDVEPGKIATILDFFSHTTSVNPNFLSPIDYTSITFSEKPLIKLDGKYLMMEKSWCSFAFYEALASPFWRNPYAKFDSIMGVAIEDYLHRQLNNNNIQTKTGTYSEHGIEGECDIVIETASHIFLIECKRKPITKKARTGDDISIFIDLFDSLHASQLQAGRTELLLKNHGRILLTAPDSSTYLLEHNNREIERISVSLHEYGGFQDRVNIQRFLEVLLTTSFGTHSTDEKVKKKFNLLEKKRQEWVEQYNELCKIDPEVSHNPFFDCWFLSVAQLTEVIRRANSNESFKEILFCTKHLSTSSMDFYREFSHGLTFLNHKKGTSEV